MKVFIRWPAIHIGRSGVRFSAVFPVKTRPAPSKPSITMNMNEPTAVLNASEFCSLFSRFQRRNAQTSRTMSKMPASELVMRCENSMIVFSSGADGMTSPWQVSQCWPQPSPDFDARRKTPHKITRILNPKTNHAYFANLSSFLSFVILLKIPFSTIQ